MVDAGHQVGVPAVRVQEAANLVGGNAGFAQDRVSPTPVFRGVGKGVHTGGDEVAEHLCECRRRDRWRPGVGGRDLPAARCREE